MRTYIKEEGTHVLYQCPKHLSKGDISSAWTHIRTGKRGCPYCSGKYKTTEDFKKEVSNIIQSVEILGEYKSARTKILTRCLVCGHEWSPEARSLLYGQGCPACGKKKRAESRRKTQGGFEHDLSSIAPHIAVAGEYVGAHKKVKCKCLIHDIEWESFPCNLLNKSAGCPMCATERFNNTPSLGEQRIAQWLKTNGVEFFSEHSMDGCVYKRQLRFDFYLPTINTVIEFDGEQHFRPVGWYANDLDAFATTQARDKAKDIYCQDHGIHMVRIPYSDYENIEYILNFELKEKALLH